MTAAREVWRAIGGPSAISRWSAIFTLVYLVPSAAWTAAYSSATLGSALIVEALAAIVALSLLWLAHTTWLSPARVGQPHRTVIALVTFFGIGLIRLGVMFATRAIAGLEQPWSPWEALATGGIYSVVILSIVAVVVNSIRSHAEAMASLRQAEQTLERARQLDVDEAESLQRSYVEEVISEVQSRIRDLSAAGTAKTVADGLQDIAEHLVRPSSHKVRDGQVVVNAVEARRPRVRFGEVIRAIAPAVPVMGPIGYEALIATAVVRDLGPSVALINAVLGTTLLVFGNLALMAGARRFWPHRGRLLLLALAYVVIGVSAAAIVSAVVTVMVGPVSTLWVGGLSYAVFMLLFSAASTLRQRQEEVEHSLVVSLAHQAEELARVRGLVADQRSRLAHLMHGGLQAELTAAAVRLSRPWGSGSEEPQLGRVVAELMEQIDRELHAIDDDAVSADWADVLDTWAMAMDLEVRTDPEAEQIVNVDDSLRRRVVDVLSESLTNAARHSVERRAVVSLSRDDQGSVVLEVRNPGVLGSNPMGLGSREMDERCAQWSRRQVGDEVVIRAEFVAPTLMNL